jgi:hypothetical protein
MDGTVASVAVKRQSLVTGVWPSGNCRGDPCPCRLVLYGRRIAMIVGCMFCGIHEGALVWEGARAPSGVASKTDSP